MQILRPCILLGDAIHRRGGATYDRRVLEDKTTGESHTRKWETRKTVFNKEEYEAAEKLVGQLRRKLLKVCTRTSFGLMCSLDREAELNTLCKEIRSEAMAASDAWETCTVSVGFIRGRISNNDAEAAKAVATEITTIMARLTEAIQAADVKLIRSIIADAKGLDQLIAPEQGQVLTGAMAAARLAAKTMRKEIIEKGRTVEQALEAVDLNPVSYARMTFLELEQTAEVETLGATDARRFASVV